jgi:hypothetical protein
MLIDFNNLRSAFWADTQPVKKRKKKVRKTVKRGMEGKEFGIKS